MLEILLALFRQYPGLADRSSKMLYKMEDFVGGRGRDKEVIRSRKAGWLLLGYFPLEDGRGLSGTSPH